jgi:NAD(P)-dependent dehydrogenase (short-subunit alcohol dehydrogenase family)
MTAILNRNSHPHLPLALVVGACGGMGLACARRLAQSHHVLLCDRNAEQLQLQAQALSAEGFSVSISTCDITSDASVAALSEAIRVAAGHHGPLTAVAHVVGLSPVADDWALIMNVNLGGATRIANAVQPLLQRGAAVFISSIAGHLAGDVSAALPILDDPLHPDFSGRLAAALPAMTPLRSYQISKFALNRLCRQRAAAWGAAGNRIVSLSPGLIATPMGQREFSNSPQKMTLLQQSPLQRQGSLQEICDVLEFLLSPRASFISGTDILVDGGLVSTLSDR